MTVMDKPFTGTILEEVPRQNWKKIIFKMPLQIWRMGLKFLLPPSFACITTRGRKSGQPRYTMVEYTSINGKLFVVSGWQDKPHWVKNLLADPQITIQPVRGELVWGTVARTTNDTTLTDVFNGMQHSPMWKPWLASLNIEPTIEDFIAKKERLYIFEINPTEGDMPLPPMTQDRRWMMGVVFAVLALIGRARFRLRKPRPE